ncbi:hypothetical protein [Succinivibrio dextrinosolvens]|uniref:hypothetical protein n=1 Tax=Succinivibrio dextrinosolvens TaxID=83771 RepID=UPI00241C2290|nr:hypothetical protein [Succinivibrio dextrinosolvens]MBE6423058.1 hypothetical protein [Succinivibrio dextrinosolvens]
MFNLSFNLLEVLENIGDFEVTVDEGFVHLQRKTPYDNDWKMSFRHYRSNYYFVSEFDKYALSYSPLEKFNEYKLCLEDKISSEQLKAAKKDIFWRGGLLRKLCELLDIEIEHLAALEQNQKLNNPLSEKLISTLKVNGIRLLSLRECSQYKGVKGSFISVVLRCFAHSDKDYLINVTFDDKCQSKNHIFRNYRFNVRFRAEALGNTARYSRYDLIEAYRVNPADALKMLSVLESQNAQLQLVAEQIDAVYNDK